MATEKPNKIKRKLSPLEARFLTFAPGTRFGETQDKTEQNTKKTNKLSIELTNMPTKDTDKDLGNYMSRLQFLKLHFPNLSETKLKSYNRMLYRLRKDLPESQKKDYLHSPDKYNEKELLECWPALRKKNPSLPELQL